MFISEFIGWFFFCDFFGKKIFFWIYGLWGPKVNRSSFKNTISQRKKKKILSRKLSKIGKVFWKIGSKNRLFWKSRKVCFEMEVLIKILSAPNKICLHGVEAISILHSAILYRLLLLVPIFFFKNQKKFFAI